MGEVPKDANSELTRSIQSPDKSLEEQMPAPKDPITSTDDHYNDVDWSFGCGPLKSARMGQLLSNLYVFSLLSGCMALFATAGYQTLTVTQMSLRAQFYMTESDITDIQTAYLAGVVVSSLFCGYFGSFQKGDIPVTLGVSSFINGLAIMAPSFLHFANPGHINAGPSPDAMFQPFVCVAPSDETSAPSQGQQSPEMDTLAYNVFVSTQVFSGLLTPVILVLAPVYIDSNCMNKVKLAVYLGIYIFMYECSTATGNAIAGLLGTLTVDFEDTDLNKLDPRYTGSWWLPQIILGGEMIILGLLMMQFPKRLISKQQQKKALSKAMFSFAVGDAVDSVFSAEKTDEVKPGSGSTTQGSGLSHTETPDPESKNLHGPDQSSVSDSPEESAKSRSSAGVDQQTNSQKTDRQSPLEAALPFLERRFSVARSLVFFTPVIPRINCIYTLMDLPLQFCRVFRNPVFILLLVEAAILGLPYKASELFRTPYQLFGLNMSMDEYSNGSFAYTITNLLGVIFGAYLSYRVCSLRGYALIMLAAYGLSALVAPLYFATVCENQELQGFEGTFGVPLPNITNNCVNCMQQMALPVCGDDGISYLSPCYAGCTAGDGFTFFNCTLLQEGTEATSSTCDAGCMATFIVYVCVLSILLFLQKMVIVPRSLLILRMMEPRDRTLGISMFIVVLHLLSIPAPIALGHIFEKVGCLLYSADGSTCLFYNRENIRYLMSGMEVGINLGLFFIALLMVLIFKMMAQQQQLTRQGSKQLMAAAST